MVDHEQYHSEADLDLEKNGNGYTFGNGHALDVSQQTNGSDSLHHWKRRYSLDSSVTMLSMSGSATMASAASKMKDQTRIADDSGVFPVCLIAAVLLVACACSVAAFILHLSVRNFGCLTGVNGCNGQLLLDLVEPLGIGKSVFFILSCTLSGLVCSLILYSPFSGGIAKRCRGGGSADTKIVISSGATVNGWVVVLRILLAVLYMGGGNPLGTEGPIIHLSSSLAIWLVSKSGQKRRKLLSTFGVIGAAAGISAGFNVHVTGFVYVIEEICRTLSAKLSLVLAFAAGAAVFVKDLLEEILEHWFHQDHTSMVPKHSTWAKLTNADRKLCLLLCIPIGVLTGIAGWTFTCLAWHLQLFLNPKLVGKEPGVVRRHLPERLHLAIIGTICGCLGAIAYESTGMNGVWGTTVGAIPEAIEKGMIWDQLLLLFVMKFSAFILATAAGGPGGLLVPSLVTGGYLGLFVARLVGVNENTCAACGVIGMGSMFASVMHMPVTGVIIIFELTRADNLSLHIALANFVATNVVYRLPHGTHSFVHRSLSCNPTWAKLDHRDFIETDFHEIEADVAMFKSTFGLLLRTDLEITRESFDAWKDFTEKMKQGHVLRPMRRTRTAITLNSNALADIVDDIDDGLVHQSSKTEDTDAGHPSEGQSEDLHRRDIRDMWESVSLVIPGLNIRVWKSLNLDQRMALADAAQFIAEATPSKGADAWGEDFAKAMMPQTLSRRGDKDIDDGLLDWSSLLEGPRWSMDPGMQWRFLNRQRQFARQRQSRKGADIIVGATTPHALLQTPRERHYLAAVPASARLPRTPGRTGTTPPTTPKVSNQCNGC